MRANRAVMMAAAAGVLAALVVAGCKDEAESLSNSGYLLKLQHEAWQNARKTMELDDSSLNVFLGLHLLLTQRTPRRVEKDYDGPDKQQVLARLGALGDAFEAEVASKLDLTGTVVRLRSGVTRAQLRESFMKLDGQYRHFEAMTSPR